MTLSAWISVWLAIPVLLFGERIVRGVPWLGRYNIPAPVVGGLVVSLLILLSHVAGPGAFQIGTKVSSAWWTWIVSIEPEWMARPEKSVHQPFLVGFFTCIGLNASWSLARRAGGQVAVFLGLAVAMAVIQNGVGIGMAKLLGEPALLGLMCGSITQTGGHGTALGFAPELERAGLQGAAVIGMAAATFGLVAGGLLGGPAGGRLIRRHRLQGQAAVPAHLELGQTGEAGILKDLRTLWSFGRTGCFHFVLLLACVKLGAWASHAIQLTGITFPVYIGAMLLGLLARNLADVTGGWVRAEVVDTMGSVLLGSFLAVAMMSLNLIELAHTAGPMLVILSAQVVVLYLFATFVTFPAMGRDYDAAVMVSGHCGFGLGATANAVANMKALVERFGPAPRAFLVVPIVGSFLVDLCNALNITFFLNLIH